MAVCPLRGYAANPPREEALYLEDPFDRVTLDAKNDDAVLRVMPLEFPDRRKPINPDPRSMLRIRMVDRPERQFDVPWAAIVKVDLFEDMLLAKAQELVSQGRLDEAGDYFRFLEERYPRLIGLSKSIEDYLYEEASFAQKSEDYSGSLALLIELYRRDPTRSELDNAMGVAAEKLVQRHVEAGNPPAARAILRTLRRPFPQHPLIRQWEDRFSAEAAKALAEAQAAAAAGRLREASLAVRQVERLWPSTPGAEDLARQLHERFPRVAVGVLDDGSWQRVDTPPQPVERSWLVDWSGRRRSRLVARTLTELDAFAPSGGRYQQPLGPVRYEASTNRLRWEPSAALLQHNDDPLRPHDVAGRWLVDARNAVGSQSFSLAEQLVAAVSADATGVTWELTQRFPSPLSILAVSPGVRIAAPYRLQAAAEDRPAQGAADEPRQVFLAEAAYYAATSTRPQEIDELFLPDRLSALRALRSGRVHVIDRVSPADAARLSRDKRISVQPYALPLVHLVLPNHARPLTASPSFRRALLMGLDRAAMLEQLMQGASLAGYEVVSGPLPVGVEAGDPLRAFSDPAISPRACDPELAALLAESARCEVLAAGTLGAAADPESPIHVVLAHPAHELTKTIAEMLARQWRLIGIEVELRPVVDPAMVPEQVDADLFLVEAAPWEPAFDLPRLLGEEGLTGGCTPYMSELLRQLLRAGSSADLQARCRAIHRLVNAETSVLPLWQWVEHYAYRSDLSGVVRPVSSVYEGVEGWRLSFVWNAGGETMP